jgi:ubiquinone biosynthesis UbiH/UbiF/VisC/COQ6 family hydroxylase
MTHTTTPAAPEQADADVLIVGAGPAGLSLAASLHDAGLTVQVLEQLPLSVLQDPPEDGREIALTHRARQVMQSLGLWQNVPEDAISPLRRAQVQDGDRPDALHFGRENLGSPWQLPRFPGSPAVAPTESPDSDEPLGWLIPNHLIRRAAWLAVQQRPAVQVHGQTQVTGLRLPGSDQPQALAQVTLADGRCLKAPLVVAADSRFSSIRRMAGIGAAMRDFGRSVVVGPVSHSQDHQGIARECFRYGNTLALLPMTSNRCSAVVTVPSDQAPVWLGLSDEQFAQRIEQQSSGQLGPMRSAGARHHYPLVGVYAHRFVSRRFALIGDAAVGMHPVTAHGFNFGLYGVQVLTQQLLQSRQAGGDIGQAAGLNAYEREHRRVSLPIYLGTNAIVSLFTDERPLAMAVRRAVLTVSERLPAVSHLIKGVITRQLMGGKG